MQVRGRESRGFVRTALCFEQRNFWSDYDIEPKDEFLAKLLHTENLFHNEIPSMNALESTDGRSHDLQKRGRRK